MEYIKKEELKEGEIYKADNGSLTYIIKATKDLNNVINIPSYNKFMKNGNFNGSYLKFIKATPEEKHWLNEAIRLDKFITFEEAMKTFILEHVECIKALAGITIGKILPVKNNIIIDGTFNNYSIKANDIYNYFKPSTKEAYDAQFVVKEPAENKTELEIWLENTKSLNLSLEDLEKYIGSGQTCNFDNIYVKLEGNLSKGRAKILFDKWNEKVIEPLPQFKVIESIETITKVENNEGNQFFIGDIVISSNGTIQTIESFDYNKAKTNIIAFTSRQSILGNSIGIDKIEHYIEPKVEVKDDFILPENWHIVITTENVNIVKQWWNSKHYGDRIWSIGACYGINNKDSCSKTEKRKLPFNNKEITFDQFQKYVLKAEVKEETLLEKAKRLYPVGTKFIACNTSEECIITTGIFQQDSMGYEFINEIDNTGNDIQTKYSYHCIYNKSNWAEIIE